MMMKITEEKITQLLIMFPPVALIWPCALSLTEKDLDKYSHGIHLLLGR